MLLCALLAAAAAAGSPAKTDPPELPSIAPAAAAFYQLKRDRVAVFLEPSLSFGRNVIGAEGAEYIGFGGAVGVEYFFADHLSAGAQLGLLLSMNNLGSNAANSSVITQLSTGTSGLFARVYF